MCVRVRQPIESLRQGRRHRVPDPHSGAGAARAVYGVRRSDARLRSKPRRQGDVTINCLSVSLSVCVCVRLCASVSAWGGYKCNYGVLAFYRASW